MRWALSFIGAGACGFVGYRIGSHGDIWLGLSMIGAGMVILAETAVHAKPTPPQPVADIWARWRQSGVFPNNAPTANAPADTAHPAGAIGAAPATLER